MPRNIRWQRTFKRVALVAFGTVIALAALEAAMRSAGSLMRVAQNHRNQRALARKHDVRILCLGESTTAGMGEHRSYPEILEEILNTQDLGVRFAVVNQGRIGATTNEIIAGLEDDLDTYAPDVVVVMMGINDGGKTHAWGDVIAPGADRWYGSFRLYKLYRLTRDALARRRAASRAVDLERDSTVASAFVPAPEEFPDALREAVQLIDRQEYDRAEAILNELLSEDPGLAQAYVELARLYGQTGRRHEAHQLLLRGADAAPAASVYAALGWSHFEAGDIEAATDIYRYLIESLLEPANVWDQTHYRVVLADIYEADGQLDRAEQTLIELVERIDPANDIAYRHLIELYERLGEQQRAAERRAAQERIRDGHMNPMTQRNYRILRAAVRTRASALVAVQYPGRRPETLTWMLDGDTDVLYVDNAFFRELEEANGYDSLYMDRFAGDFGHLTESGNRQLARSVARAIVEGVLGRSFVDDPRYPATPTQQLATRERV